MKTGIGAVLMLLVIIAGLSSPLLADTDAAQVIKVSTGLVDIELKDTSVKTTIDKIFEGRGLKYIIQPGVTGNIVELKLVGVKFEDALKAIGDAAGFTYMIEEGIYMISPKVTPKPVIVASAEPASSKMQAQAPQSEMNGQVPYTEQQPGSQVTINNMPTIPVFVENVQPYVQAQAYQPYYQVGNVRIFTGGGSPVVVTGGGSTVRRRWTIPPPEGWFSPDMERFLRWRWAVPSRSGSVPLNPY